MGNYMPCASMPNGHLTAVSGLASRNSVKVMYPNGVVEEFQAPVFVAELMLENPEHFVWDFNSVNASRRAPALPADTKLEVGHLYYLLPSNALSSAALGLSSKRDSLYQEQRTGQKFTLGEALNMQSMCKPKMPTQPFEIKQKGEVTQVMVLPQYLTELMMQNSSNVLEGDSFSNNTELLVAYRRHAISKNCSWKPKLETVEEISL